MPVQVYVPPEDEPREMSYFNYGCCVSSSQALWLVIFSFVFLVLATILLCLAAVFVRWVYKRRLRKKVEEVKARFRQEDREKREKRLELDMIAKRPIVKHRHRASTADVTKLVEKAVSTTHMCAHFGGSGDAIHTAKETKEQKEQKEIKNKEEKSDKKFAKENTTVLLKAGTLSGIVHCIARTKKAELANNPSFEGLSLGYRDPNDSVGVQSLGSEGSCVGSASRSYNHGKNKGLFARIDDDDSTQYSRKSKDEKADDNPTIREKGNRWSPMEDKTQASDPDEAKKKKKEKAISDFPYYVEKKQPTRSQTSQVSMATTQVNPSSISLPQNTKKEEIPLQEKKKEVGKAYNVYELRRLAEKQAGQAEQEEACELIRNRQQQRPKETRNDKEAQKRVAQVYKTKDIEVAADSPSDRR